MRIKYSVRAHLPIKKRKKKHLTWQNTGTPVQFVHLKSCFSAKELRLWKQLTSCFFHTKALYYYFLPLTTVVPLSFLLAWCDISLLPIAATLTSHQRWPHPASAPSAWWVKEPSSASRSRVTHPAWCYSRWKSKTPPLVGILRVSGGQRGGEGKKDEWITKTEIPRLIHEPGDYSDYGGPVKATDSHDARWISERRRALPRDPWTPLRDLAYPSWELQSVFCVEVWGGIDRTRHLK